MRSIITRTAAAVIVTVAACTLGVNEHIEAGAYRADGDSVKVGRPRARDIGIEVGILPTGRQNAITDVL